MTLNQKYNYDSRLKSANELVLSHPERFSAIGPGKWLYQGSKGETYEINTDLLTCTCADHVYRCMGLSDQPCKHLIGISIIEEDIKKLVNEVLNHE